MDTINNVLLEIRLILRSRGALLAALLMIAIAILSGFVVPYRSATASELSLNRTRELMQQQAEESKETITLDMSDMINQVKADFQALHPVAAPNRIMSIFAALGPLILAILGAHIAGSEFIKRTVKARAAHCGWNKCMIAKLMLIIFISTIVAAAGSLIGLTGGRIAWHVVTTGPSEIVRDVPPPHLISPHWQQMLLVILGLSFYGILGIFIATATHSSLAGAVTGVATAFIEQLAVAQLPTLWFLPQNIYSNLLINTFIYFEGSGIGKPLFYVIVESVWLCWLILIAWNTILFFSAWQLSKRQAI